MDYKLKDGSTISGPEPSRLNDEQKAWLVEQGAGGLGDSSWVDAGKSLVSGLAEGTVRAPFVGGDLFALAARLREKLQPGSTSEQNRRLMSDEVLGVAKDLTGLEPHVPTTTAGRYVNAGANAVGGGAMFGIPGLARTAGTAAAVKMGTTSGVTTALGQAMSNTVRNPNAQNAVIGLGSEAAGEIDPSNPLWKLGGAGGTALALAIAARIKNPRAAQPIYDTGKGTDWEAAAARNAELESVGAGSRTVADALPLTNQMRGMARGLSNTAGGHELYAKLAGRPEGDIARLVDEARIKAQQTAMPTMLPSTSVEGAEKIFKEARGNRTQAMLGHLQGQPLVPEETLQMIARALRGEANLPANQLGSQFPNYLGNAARTVDQVPRYPIPQPVQGPVSGPGVLTGGPASVPPTPGPRTPAIPGPAPAPQAALPAPAGPVVPYAPGLNEVPNTPWSRFRFPDNQPITDINFPTPQGANLEALSKAIKMLDSTVPATEGTAAQVLKTSGSVHASKTADALLKQHSEAYKQAMQTYQDMSPQVDIARLLAEGRLRATPNPAGLGLPETKMREELVAALEKLDPQAAQTVTNKLRAADTLSQLTAESGLAGMNQQMGQSTLASVLTPATTTRNQLNFGVNLQAQKQISHLLANPTPENRAILKALTVRDPALAQRLREMTNLGAINASTERN